LRSGSGLLMMKRPEPSRARLKRQGEKNVFTFGGSLRRRRTHPQALEKLETHPPWRQPPEDEESPRPRWAVFEESMVGDVPDPARRWLLHAIRPETQIATRAHLLLSGEIRPDPGMGWLPLKAEENLAPPFRLDWTGAARRGLTVLRMEEHYAVGAAEMRSAWFGILPVARRSGPEFSRSTLARLVLESIWVPFCLLPQRGVAWEAVDTEHARARLTVNQTSIALTLTVEADGRLREASVERYGERHPGRWELFSYVFRVRDECPFSGCVIPSELDGGWNRGRGFEESVRYRVDQVEFF
jgi:hypothetical protein